MFKVIKNKGKILKAFRLGDHSRTIERLITEGRIVALEDGKYEVFSQEVDSERTSRLVRRRANVQGNKLSGSGKRLSIESGRSHYFSAPLWGTVEAADVNAVLIFYSIIYAEDGTVEDVSYNVVEGKEFEKTYSRC